MGVYEDIYVDEIVKLKKENKKLQAENKELKEWRRRWDAGAAERKWKALGGSW